MGETLSYEASCHHCLNRFEAFEAPWCSCLVSERSLLCPFCGKCFCKATPEYKQRFWGRAPRELKEHKRFEHTEPFEGARAATPLKRPLVLLVDDEPDIQRVASRVIQSLGYGLLVARNGQEGLQAARRHRPDLVLTDALMPKLDGREMGRRIKEDPDLAGTRVVVMTALYKGARYHGEAYKTYKVDGYVTKPLEFAALRDLLEKHLG